jgi:hypothetical protein
MVSFLNAQSLFESAENDADSKNTTAFDLNGYVRGVYFVGNSLDPNPQPATQSAYGEAALKIGIDKADFGEAFAEIRMYDGYAWGSDFSGIDVREAWVKYYAGKFDFSFGKQIKVWGRADGFNPTNMLSPQNMIARSANEDDKRFGNWMATGAFTKGIINVEAIWIPVYQSHLVPFGLIEQKMGMPFNDPNYPNFDLDKSSFALRLNILASKADGSISYFNGYSLKPGIEAQQSMLGPVFNPIAYHVNMLGADFQTTLGKYGLRGEVAFTMPTQDQALPYIPNDDIQYVLGIDRTFGNLSVLLQYSGRYVLDFEALPSVLPPDSMQIFMIELEKRNRLFNQQQFEVSHTAIGRIGYKFFHETLDVNLLGMYNFTTEELMLRPKLTYSITDAMELAAGMEYYQGPANTMYGLLSEIVTAGFVELKVSF